MTEPEPTATPKSATKAEIIREISLAIAERRKARGLSLDKIYQNIKIRIPYLDAIEKGQWDQLPGDVYIRGFIKRYADHLGFDAEKLMAPYLQSEKAQEKEAAESPPLLKGTEFTRVQLISVGIAAIVAIILIKLIKTEKPALPAPQKSSAAESAPPAAVAAPVQAAATPVVPLEKHRLDVYSPLPLWLRVTSEDNRVFEGFIPQGSTWTWRGGGKFTIRFGHTRELSMLFDGNPVVIAENQKKIDLPQ